MQTWPLWKRDLILSILCFVSVIATTTSPLLAADSVYLAQVFAVTFQDAALMTAYHLCGVAVGGILSVASARVWGKRHLFLFGALLMVASSAWGGSTVHTRSYSNMIWARILQGVALAPFEALVNACVGDLYFLHERGKRMALTNVSLFGGAFLTPVFVGMITYNPRLGWQWSFYFVAIFMAAGFVLLLFFVPETAYWRPAHLDIDMLGKAPSADSLETPPEETTTSEEEKTPQVTDGPVGVSYKRASYLQRLLPFNGRKSDESFFKLLIRPLPLFLHPAIAWGCIIQGAIIGWTVMVAVIISVIFLGPPLFFTELQTGYQYTAAFVGSMIGLVLSGLVSDSSTKLMIRWNKGVYEPEFRIVLIIPMLVFAIAGLYGFGITASNPYKYNYIIPDVFLAMIIISMVMGAVASALYIVDAHRDIAVEAFTCLLMFKNLFSFLLAYNAYTWVFTIGIKQMFVIFASIEVGLIMLSVPMYVFGKWNRAFFYRNDILKMARLK